MFLESPLIHGWLHVMVGAFASHQSQDGHTAWSRAAVNGHVDCLRMLVEGADKFAQNDVRMMMSLIPSNFVSIDGYYLAVFLLYVNFYIFPAYCSSRFSHNCMGCGGISRQTLRMAIRRLFTPLEMATLNAFVCWWKAALIRTPKSECVTSICLLRQHECIRSSWHNSYLQ